MAAQRRTFTKTIDGRTETAYATTAADAVRLRFGGWREREPDPGTQTGPGAQPAAAPQKTTAEPKPAATPAATTTSTPARAKAKTGSDGDAGPAEQE